MKRNPVPARQKLSIDRSGQRSAHVCLFRPRNFRGGLLFARTNTATDKRNSLRIDTSISRRSEDFRVLGKFVGRTGNLIQKRMVGARATLPSVTPRMARSTTLYGVSLTFLHFRQQESKSLRPGWRFLKRSRRFRRSAQPVQFVRQVAQWQQSLASCCLAVSCAPRCVPPKPRTRTGSLTKKNYFGCETFFSTSLEHAINHMACQIRGAILSPNCCAGMSIRCSMEM